MERMSKRVEIFGSFSRMEDLKIPTHQERNNDPCKENDLRPHALGVNQSSAADRPTVRGLPTRVNSTSHLRGSVRLHSAPPNPRYFGWVYLPRRGCPQGRRPRRDGASSPRSTCPPPAPPRPTNEPAEIFAKVTFQPLFRCRFEM
jgi:hypothetical protein